MRSLFLPVVAMVVLTFVIWLLMYYRRIAEMHTSKINPQSLDTSQAASTLLRKITAADNLKNLFEVPVLFYVICIILEMAGNVSTTQLLLAWCYVTLRCMHSFIHVTYNRVVHRFSVYIASCVVVFTMWTLFALQLLSP